MDFDRDRFCYESLIGEIGKRSVRNQTSSLSSRLMLTMSLSYSFKVKRKYCGASNLNFYILNIIFPTLIFRKNLIIVEENQSYLLNAPHLVLLSMEFPKNDRSSWFDFSSLYV